MALDIKPGDEIITTPFTFFSTAGSISRLNAVPVFVDIDPITFNIDPKKIEKAITKKTKAIIPVHLFGQCADMNPILDIAKKHNIKIIEDAAQSIGAEYQGRRSGAIGDLGIFSFFPSKNLGGFGDGGMVVTDNFEFYERLIILRAHGSRPKYYHSIVGGNFRLDALQAAILSVKLKHLDEWSQGRRLNAAYYDEKIIESRLSEKGFIKLPTAVYQNCGDKNHHIYNQYTLRVQSRDKLQEFLKTNDIGTAIYYPLPLHIQECFKDLDYKKGDLPISEEASETVLSVPIYPEMAQEQKDDIIHKLIEFYN